ncbi:MAG: hypothetical protein FWF56_04105 [Firmicutes bacterium]|nr:hypothetical protein [Bacillota bacterium]MCL1953177.1 hypothetical protein [Bacillota bacterium]
MKKQSKNKGKWSFNSFILIMVACIMIGVIFLFVVLHFILPLHNSNNSLQMSRNAIVDRPEKQVEQTEIVDSKVVDSQQPVVGTTPLTATEFYEHIENSNIEETAFDFSELTPDNIMSLMEDNSVNIVVVGSTLLLIAVLAWLLKKNTEMRMVPKVEETRIRAAEALAYAMDLFNSAKELVYKSHEQPDDSVLESEALNLLQDTDQAIDIATELVAEYTVYLEQDSMAA